MPAVSARRLIGIRVLGACTGAVLVVTPLLALKSGGSEPARPRARPLPGVVSATGLLERNGVRVVRVAASGGGGLVDLRYQVVDPQKAAAVHDADTPPALVDEATGLVVGHLLMDHMPHGTPRAGVTYYMVFVNPGQVVRRGGRVGVVLGGARLAHVPVS